MIGRVANLLRGDAIRDRIMPPSPLLGAGVLAASIALSTLAALAMLVVVQVHTTAARWTDDLSRAVTLQLPSGLGEDAQTKIASILSATPGVLSSTELSAEAQRALIAPFLGRDLTLDLASLPMMISLDVQPGQFDETGLRARLAGELPGVRVIAHGQGRQPLLETARSIRWLAIAALVLVQLGLMVLVALAVMARLASNRQVIETLRLVGANDALIERGFGRQITMQTGLGAVIGTVIAGLAGLVLPLETGALTFMLLLVPIAALASAWLASRQTARYLLRQMS